jgi:hypothetical protein
LNVDIIQNYLVFSTDDNSHTYVETLTKLALNVARVKKVPSYSHSLSYVRVYFLRNFT